MIRVVVKVGSSSLTSTAGGLDRPRLDAVVAAIAATVRRGEQVVLVSSGAIAAGLAPLGLPSRPRDLATLQAAAAVGQTALIDAYASAFGTHGLTVGQVLLTAEDIMRRAHYRNARVTLDRLIELGVVPIVNENDTVANTEIRFGDNDRLAALVAHLVDADRLLLLSDVDGVYDKSPRLPGAQRVAEIRGEWDLAGLNVQAPGTGLGRGGMASKVEAARIAADSGVPAVIGAAAQVDELLRATPGYGTAFFATGTRDSSRRRWLAHASVPRGRLVLDSGAVRAVRERGASLLPAGVTEVQGEFVAGDPVELVDVDAVPLARGLVAYDSAELPALLGLSTRDSGLREVVHRDDLVLLRS